jgi:hypothetical protein
MTVITNGKTPAIGATIAGAKLTLTFAHGRTLILDTGELSEEIQNQALMHGLKQKLVDAAAISRDPDTGRTADIETKFNAVCEVYERLLAGEWNKVTRDGSGGNVGGLLLRALVRMYDGRKTREELVAFLEGKTDAEKAALRASPKIAPIIAEIKAEDAAKKPTTVDTDDLLAGLDN